MTKTDKQSASGALLLMAGCVFLGYQKHHPNLAFTIGFPSVMFVLYAWMGRASSADWLVRHDAYQLVFRKPLVFQTLNLLFALLLAGIAVVICRSPTAGAEARYFIIAFFGAVCLPFLSMAEPSRFAFDLSRQEYTWTRGFWPLVRTSRGRTKGGTVQLTEFRKGSCRLLFRPAGGSTSRFRADYGNVVASCTHELAEAQAYGLADALGVQVERKT